MKHVLEVCLITLVLANTGSVSGQSSVEPPLQRGVAVELPVTGAAVAVPDADKQDAFVVTLTYDGHVYVGAARADTDSLLGSLRVAFSGEPGRTLFVKADARTPYANVVRILDAARASGVQRVTLLTAQPVTENAGTLLPPEGLEMLMTPRR